MLPESGSSLMGVVCQRDSQHQRVIHQQWEQEGTDVARSVFRTHFFADDEKQQQKAKVDDDAFQPVNLRGIQPVELHSLLPQP